MTEIVINKCFGGFGLSVEAQKKMAETGCEHMKWMPEDEYFKSTESREDRDKFYKMCEVLGKDGKTLDDGHDMDDARACPLLVNTVREMGKDADGQHARLKIVDIPDGVEWIVEDYDGQERIAEKHRTWG